MIIKGTVALELVFKPVNFDFGCLTNNKYMYISKYYFLIGCRSKFSLKKKKR